MTRMPVAVVFSPRPDVADFLKRVLDSSGIATFATSDGKGEIEDFVTHVRPDVVVYHLGEPTDADRADVDRLARSLARQDVPMVFTTRDRASWTRYDLPGTIVEMFNDPGDLAELRAGVRAALRSAGGVLASRP